MKYGRMIMNDDTGRIWKKEIMTVFNICPRTWVDEL